MSALKEEEVQTVHHWTPGLFSFTTTRDPGFQFSNGHFTLVGLKLDNKPLLRPYSIASPNHERHLEFLSIAVEGGALTSHLRHIKPGDRITISRRPTGTLVIDYLRPGKRLYLLATGTGLAPFMSLVRDPTIYAKYERIILVHGVRTVAELAYRDLLTKELPQDPSLGKLVSKQLSYYPIVTRENFVHMGRIPALIDSGKLFNDIGMPALDAIEDRVMVCGSAAMNQDIKHMLERKSFAEGNTSTPGDFVVERAFVKR